MSIDLNDGSQSATANAVNRFQRKFLTAVGLPPNATYVDNLNGTGSFSFSPNFTQSGVINVTFIASDGALADSEVVAITVTRVNLAPVLAAIGPRSVP